MECIIPRIFFSRQYKRGTLYTCIIHCLYIIHDWKKMHPLYETLSVSRQPYGCPIMDTWNLSVHHSTIVSRGTLNWAPMKSIDTSVSWTTVFFFYFVFCLRCFCCSFGHTCMRIVRGDYLPQQFIVPNKLRRETQRETLLWYL